MLIYKHTDCQNSVLKFSLPTKFLHFFTNTKLFNFITVVIAAQLALKRVNIRKKEATLDVPTNEVIHIK